MFVTSKDPANRRAESEIEHGKKLAGRDAEWIWGWGTPAGKRRAVRRAGLIADGARLGVNSRALEIGCGTGLFTEMFAQTGARLIAVDISVDLLKKALQRNLPSPRVQFIEKRFEECELDAPFDAVIGSSVLHHLDVESSCRKMFELLKPGGSISFAEPNMLNPQIFLERKFRRFFPQVSRDETAFIRWKFKKTLLREGFTAVKITPFDWLHPATPARLIPVVEGIGRILEKIPLLREFAGSLHIYAMRPLE